MSKAYVMWSLGWVLFLGWAGLTGWQREIEPPQQLHADVRQSPGGYRSFHFWHSGWQGGK
jgi:hypothetical protein